MTFDMRLSGSSDSTIVDGVAWDLEVSSGYGYKRVCTRTIFHSLIGGFPSSFASKLTKVATVLDNRLLVANVVIQLTSPNYL
jgi:hypothetical protein